MTKTIPSICIAEYHHKKEDRRVLPGSNEIIHHDEDTFERLKKAGCVKHAPEQETAPEVQTPPDTKSTGAKPATGKSAKAVDKGNGSPDSERAES